MYYGYGYGGDMLYSLSWIVLIPAMIFTMSCQAKIKSSYNKFSRIRNSRGLTGAQAAARMLSSNGLGSVEINMHNGNSLQNYYDPRNKSLNLSREVYNSNSISSVCIACHEVGHAIQDASHYPALSFRNSIVPVVNLTQTLSWPLIIFGLGATWGYDSRSSFLFDLGVLCFCVVILFHLVTLPVEFNASNRALEQMRVLDMVDETDYIGSRTVLRAAAMTYVAALATAVANLLRVLLIARRRR